MKKENLKIIFNKLTIISINITLKIYQLGIVLNILHNIIDLQKNNLREMIF